MLPEMTDNYHLLPVLIVACSTSYFISTLLMRGSICTMKLKRGGIEIEPVIDSLKLVKVSEIMTSLEKVVSVKRDTSFSILYFVILESKTYGILGLRGGEISWHHRPKAAQRSHAGGDKGDEGEGYVEE